VITQLLPAPALSHDPEDEGFRDWLSALYAPENPSLVRINMIASINGSAVGTDGSSDTLTGGNDRRIMGVLRTHADVVVVGARTVRREGLSSPRRARLAVVTRSGDLTGHRLEESASIPLIVCPPDAIPTVEEQLAGVEHEIVETTAEAIDPVEIVAALNDRGMRSIICEGGPSLAAAFLDAGVVDELCMTTSPKLRSPGVPMLARVGAMLDTHLIHLLVDDESYLYARWAIDGPQ